MIKGDILVWLLTRPWFRRLPYLLEGRLIQQLLACFFEGYSVKHLRQLLESKNTSVVTTGAYLAWELQHDAQPIIEALQPLLLHESTMIRAYSAEAILLCAGPPHRKLVDQVVSLGQSDSNAAVRKTIARALKSSSGLGWYTGRYGQ